MDSKTKSHTSANEQIKSGGPALMALVRLLARQAARELVNADVKTVRSEKEE